MATWTPEQLAAFRERNRQNAHAWRQAYPEKHRANVKSWNKRHSAQVKASNKRSALKRVSQIKARAAAYYQKNKGEVLARTNAYRRMHPEMAAASQRKRRAARNNAPINNLTAAQWLSIKEHYGFCCVYCSKKQRRLTQDHIVPLSKGGGHTYSNVVPACRSCNSKKGAGAVLFPVQPLLVI